MSAPILVIDNYDSFTWNLVHYLMELGAEVEVVRNDALSAGQAISSGAAGFLLSPGPCTPNEAGISLDLVGAAADAGKPLLGVCLGHQSIGQYFGGKVVRGGLMHGKTSPVTHDGSGVFAGIPSPFTATRYHSLAVERETVPDELEITAHTASGIVMALRHRDLPLEGVQFHPESVLTEGGHRLLANWLGVCGNAEAVGRSAGLAPLVRA
jgi:anthranilate synthase component 2